MTTAAAIAIESTQAICCRCHLPIPDESDYCRLCAAAIASHLPERIGPYRVLGRLGSGPGTSVYECADSDGKATLAVKVFTAGDDAARMAGERRLREARAWMRLGHPGLVRLHGVGRWCGSPFLAMERLEGRSVEDLLVERGRMEPLAALRIAVEAARALEAGCARGLVHRAIKASNLLLAADGSVRLADPGSTTLPATRALAGDEVGPDPLAPEFHDGTVVDFRADIYALGITLGRMLGVFEDRKPGEDVYEPPPVVARILLRMTAHRREDRFAHYIELRTALAEAIAAVDPEVHQSRNAATHGWASAGALTGFVLAAAVSAFLPPPEATIPTRVPAPRVAHQRDAATSIQPTPEFAPEPETSGPDGDAVTAVIRETVSGPASYAYVMGSEEVGSSFTIETGASARKPRRLGGRVVVPPGVPMTWVHRSDVMGDIRAELDVVLNPAATADLLLRTTDGRALVARIRAWTTRPELSQREALAGTISLADDAGVLLLTGSPAVPVSGIALGVTPGRPHHLEIRRTGNETQVFVDGRETLRTEVAIEGSFRIGISAPRGGAEIRSFAFSADHEIIPAPTS